MDIAIRFEGRWVYPNAFLIQFAALLLACGLIVEWQSHYGAVRALRDLVAAGF